MCYELVLHATLPPDLDGLKLCFALLQSCKQAHVIETFVAAVTATCVGFPRILIICPAP